MIPTGNSSNRTEEHSAGEVSSPIGGWVPALANGVEFPHFGASSTFARFLIVLAPAQLFLQAAKLRGRGDGGEPRPALRLLARRFVQDL